MSRILDKSCTPVPYDIERGHEHLLANCYGIDATTGDPIDPSTNTKRGHQLDGTNNLHEAASRLSDGEAVLNDNLKIIQDPKATKKDKKLATNTIKKLGSLMSVAAHVTSGAANIVSPITGTGPAHQRLQNLRGKELEA